ncbi:MAG TPA: DUF4258 domain-containing protein [Aggregatilineales bacterium]|nr:DUF4258 domain-containing protein [Aggregatilineales bacterium]
MPRVRTAQRNLILWLVLVFPVGIGSLLVGAAFIPSVMFGDMFGKLTNGACLAGFAVIIPFSLGMRLYTLYREATLPNRIQQALAARQILITNHAKDRMRDRQINIEMIAAALLQPDQTKKKADGKVKSIRTVNRPYRRSLPLHVVTASPDPRQSARWLVVTAFVRGENDAEEDDED